MQSPKQTVRICKTQLDRYDAATYTRGIAHIEQNKRQFSGVIRTLEALNPLAIMHKGFNVTYKEGKVIKSIEQLSKDDEIQLALSDGIAQAKILSTQKKEE